MVAAAPAAAAAMRKSFLVPEIKPLDQYDFPRARSAASLAWVLAKAYGGAVPPLPYTVALCWLLLQPNLLQNYQAASYSLLQNYLVLTICNPGYKSVATVEEHIPAELREPFYTDQYEQEHMKPPLIRLLLSSDVYCRAWCQALPSGPDGTLPPKDNAALLQLLAHQGLVPTFQDKPVKEADLHHKPIKLNYVSPVILESSSKMG
ncbi:hypothetical protein E2320_015602 [Naja naja]|nr:hypothetical protein E2320_015602 [Naja naja]